MQFSSATGVLGFLLLTTVGTLGFGSVEPPVAEELTGTVMVTAHEFEEANQTKVLVRLDAKEEGNGLTGVVDRLYTLQTGDPMRDFVPIVEKDVTVRYVRGEAKLFRPGETSPFLVLTTRKVGETPSVRTVTGFGLARQQGMTDGLWTIEEIGLTDLQMEFLTPGCMLRAGCTECDSGGEESTECGITGCPAPPTGCDVSCGEDTYACCCCLPLTHKAKCECVGVT